MEIVIAHEIENSLLAPPPRKAHLPWRPQFLLLLAYILSLLLFFAGSRALFESLRIAWVAVSGKTTIARVTSIDTLRVPKGQTAPQIGASYEYLDPFTLKTMHQHALISLEPAESQDYSPDTSRQAKQASTPPLHVGQMLSLRIARGPGYSMSYFWSPAPWGKCLFLFLCGVVVMGVGVQLILTLERWRRLRVSLLREGQAVVGTILQKRSDVTDTPHYYLCYGYATHTEFESQQHEERVSPEQWKQFEVGQPVTVLYHPDRPSEAGLYALMS